MEQRSEAVTSAKANYSDVEELKRLISTLKDESTARHEALVEALTEERKWKRDFQDSQVFYIILIFVIQSQRVTVIIYYQEWIIKGCSKIEKYAKDWAEATGGLSDNVIQTVMGMTEDDKLGPSLLELRPSLLQVSENIKHLPLQILGEGGEDEPGLSLLQVSKLIEKLPLQILGEGGEDKPVSLRQVIDLIVAAKEDSTSNFRTQGQSIRNMFAAATLQNEAAFNSLRHSIAFVASAATPAGPSSARMMSHDEAQEVTFR